MSTRYGGGLPMRTGSGYGNLGRAPDDYDGYRDGRSRDPRERMDRYGSPSQTLRGPPPPAIRKMPSRTRIQDTSAERQITQVLDHIRADWPSMCENDSLPVQLALQLLDTSSVGRAHEYRKFQDTHRYLQDSLKNIVHEHHQGFNSSIGTFHKIQGSIQASQKRVRELRESLAASKASLCSTDTGLKKLSQTSHDYDELLQTLNELDDLRAVPDQLEARISEKRFLAAVEVLQNALRKLRRPELDGIKALNDLRLYLANQETALMDILVEELHEHLYLKSPYCQERWQSLAKAQGAIADAYGDSGGILPFHAVLERIELEKAAAEDPMKNPEADTFHYIGLLVEALNKLGRLQNAVETLKQRLPVELFGVVNETTNEVDQRHPSSLRGAAAKADGVFVYNSRDTQMRADVIYDLLWTLYGKFEAIAEGQRVFHEFVKSLIRREGAGNNSALLGSFKELWNLYQNEIRSLLHNYVTTDADVYQFDTPNPGASLIGKKDIMREHLFKFAEADAKSADMAIEYDALEGIIQATVPGLTSTSRKGGADSSSSKKNNRVTMDGGGLSRRHMELGFMGSSAAAGASSSSSSGKQMIGTYKSLVEPSVFNMSLLLSPTLNFLQRLKTIVPPGSDLATSTLTTFLDNFLVNVFQPQLDETLMKLSDAVFVDADSFAQDPAWNHVAPRPVFKGTTLFFQIVTAFCRMLGTIPPDQALSSLIVTQMARYYDRCLDWYKSLVTKTQEQGGKDAANNNLRAAARFSIQLGPLEEVVRKLWNAKEDAEVDTTALLDQEIRELIEQTDETRLEMNDVIQDRDTILSLCLLYTSMKWLAAKISCLRHITMHETDSSRQALPPRQPMRRWTMMGDRGNKAAASASSASSSSDQGPVHLPLTQETVQKFDSIVTSYEDLATTALLTLHMEARCRIIYSLRNALSPEIAPYLLDQEVREPDPAILSLNLELVLFDETIVRSLRAKEVSFIRTGLGRLINHYLVANAKLASPMNEKGCGRMQLNILVLQQNLKNIEEDVDLARAANYFALFDRGPDAILEKAREAKEGGGGKADEEGACSPADVFTYEELKALMELCFSEPMADRERGIASSARRRMDDKLQGLSEHMWQS
ncbi:exocyst subunit [Claviceps pusilla]|uniref:Exocyst complex component Sec8 n=1 Tax=Claviceps pusilla TaxID=123648 RepID=A0A9P7NBM1_9HYPO|nr:exocyst subunit [Claviceps pusilla]